MATMNLSFVKVSSQAIGRSSLKMGGFLLDPVIEAAWVVESATEQAKAKLKRFIFNFRSQINGKGSSYVCNGLDSDWIIKN